MFHVEQNVKVMLKWEKCLVDWKKSRTFAPTKENINNLKKHFEL